MMLKIQIYHHRNKLHFKMIKIEILFEIECATILDFTVLLNKCTLGEHKSLLSKTLNVSNF